MNNDDMSMATRADISDVRAEIARMWADVRDNANRHSDDDTRRFDQVTDQIDILNKTLAEWTGSLRLLKWTGGICLPLILGAVVTHLIRHWSN